MLLHFSLGLIVGWVSAILFISECIPIGRQNNNIGGYQPKADKNFDSKNPPKGCRR